MGLIKSKKHKGVYYYETEDGDEVYYFTYKRLIDQKKFTVKVGTKSGGWSLTQCHAEREKAVNEMRAGHVPTLVRNKRKIAEITSFDMIAEEYYQYKKLYMTDVNWKDAVSIYTNHIKPYLGNKDIEKITSSDIEDIMNTKKAKLANKTINIIAEKIGTIFYFAIKKKLFKGINPIIDIKKLPENNERLRFLSKDEITLLLEATKKHSDAGIHLFTYLAISTGARLVNICNLKVQDIDFKHKVISIYDYKNKSYYKAFLRSDEEFIQFLKNQLRGKKPMDYILGDRTLVGHKRFIQRELSFILDELFNLDYLLYKNKKDLDKDLKSEVMRNKVVIHTLRHTFASQLVINGTPIFTVQKLMNHKDIKMTMRYSKLSNDSGRDSINGIF
ncbi:tyrosine-type recombinase/integrase [Sulfurospirillum cavolei]|uniref:tyrosine-type recombinase/integrase n=1 Tax=Sulfurospirillum cavolei TaxID=366522 RepID=UPI0005A76674|nr:site-specific integrase [Sulfurospirillum cavolei]